MQTASKFGGIGGLHKGRSKMNTKRFSIVPPIVGLAFVLLSCFSASSSAAPAWKLYEPVAEVVVPTGDANVPRAVEEKDGYVYLLVREGVLYTYDISDLPLQESFTTYNTPVHKLILNNGNGILRDGNYLYVFGGSGLETIDVQNPGTPLLLNSNNELNTYNMVRHENYLIAAGWQRIAVFSIDEPSNPILLSDLSLGEEQLVWSAAVYDNILYVCNWTSDWQGSYTNYLSVINFSNPASLSVLNTISRDDQAYHLHVIGDQLIECTSNQVGLWDLTRPADPVLLASKQAGGRVCAVDGENIVTNGAVFRPDGNELQIVATFKSGGSQRDGHPYGSTVNESYLFIAQHSRILILNASMPPLSINHASGAPGSFFMITGHGFPPNRTASFVVNSYKFGEVDTDEAGDCFFLLGTEQADEGRYVVTATIDPSASTSFVIASDEPVHPQEGSGTIFQVPSGIAYATYSGGSGTANDPYQIATAADLIALGETPEDYDKHFILMADIDLDPNLPGRKVFDKALIAPNVNDVIGVFQGIPFIGVFDGKGHSITHLTIKAKGYAGLFGQTGLEAKINDLGIEDVNIDGLGYCVGGLLGYNSGSVTRCHSTGAVNGNWEVGGLVGFNTGTVSQSHSTNTATRGVMVVGGLVGVNWGWNGPTVTQCYSTGAVDGNDVVGGLVGLNGGWMPTVAHCYSTATASGDTSVGGLVAANGGTVTQCYSTGAVRGGGGFVGGLVGRDSLANPAGGMVGTATACFWDIDTSAQATSAGGTGRTTAEMQTASTFLEAGWDFVGEAANGTEDIWWILEGEDYPRLWWESE
jgi:hypothetical protein